LNPNEITKVPPGNEKKKKTRPPTKHQRVETQYDTNCVVMGGDKYTKEKRGDG